MKYYISKYLIFTIFVLLAIIALNNQNLNAQCNVSIISSDTIGCLGDSIELNVLYSSYDLGTTLQGLNGQTGIMFDIKALNAISISNLDCSFEISGGGPYPYEVAIYYKEGSYNGFQTQPNAWNLIGTASNIIPQGPGIAVPLPIPVNLIVNSGQTISFYIVVIDGLDVEYSDGIQEGAIFASDENITVMEGIGTGNIFGGSFYSPRRWNGIIHYNLLNEMTGLSYLWNTGDTTTSIKVATQLSPINYSVSAYSNICGDSLTDSILIHSLPVVNLGNDTFICSTESVTLDAGNYFSYYNWSTFDFTQSITLNGSELVLGENEISILVIDTNECASRDTIIIEMDYCLGLEKNDSYKFDINIEQTEEYLSFNFDKELSLYTLSIHDLKGSLIFRTSKNQQHQVLVPRTSFVPGVYIYSLSTRNSHHITGKLVLN